MTTPTARTSPLSLGPTDKVAIVAGSGRLPVNVAEALAAQGHDPKIFLVRGEADLASGLTRFEHETIDLGAAAKFLPGLRKGGVTHLVMAGGIGRRPAWREIVINFWLLRRLPKALLALASGDNGLLSALVRTIEAEGVRVVGAHEVVPDLLAPEGPLTRCRPRKSDQVDLDAAYKAARALGALDIGQGAVSIGGRVIAVEGIEGTDGLLQRVKDLRGHGRLAGKERGVLVKCVKPGQELRADLPSIGPATVEAAHAAGLAGIGVEASRSLMLDSAELLARAEALGLFVIGLPQGEAQ